MIDLNRVKHLRVLVVGDGIMDEYWYVQTIGKAVKENALSAMVGKRETFYGGVWAAAKHTENFCKEVHVMVGTKIMWNRRLVDDVYLRKLFVMHEMKNYGESVPNHDIGGYDLVIVTDFGHGLLTKELIARLTKEARFLAVNAQTNSTNYGFNLITKYPRADFIVIDEMEARLAAHDKDSDIEDVILALGYKNIIVTRGAHGAIGFDGAFERQPALTDKVVDSMGAGDAFLAVASPFAAAGFSMRDLVKIGNAAGAAKCAVVGHRSSISIEDITKCLGG